VSKSAILVIILVLFLGGRSVYLLYFAPDERIEGFFRTQQEVSPSFVDCLREEGVVIYGSSASQGAAVLEEDFGGIEAVRPIYLDCEMGSEAEFDRCQREKKTEYFPEIQIKGELYETPIPIRRAPEKLSQETGCEL